MTDKKENGCARIANIGGQAVMEGVMMKSPTSIAMAVRTGDGSIVTDQWPYEAKAKKGTFWGLPILRGIITFWESLSVGMKTITRSAELFGDEIEEEPSKFEKWLAKVSGKSVENIVIAVAVVLAVLISVGLFFVLPAFISGLIMRFFDAGPMAKALVEGLVRLCVFFGYLFAVRLMKDAKRLFMYHGAEHKVLACYESNVELTPKNAREFTRFHPRCGTNYLFLVMAVSILFFAMVGFNANFLLRLASRLIFLPVVAGLSYEVLRFGAKENVFSRIVRAPGLALQRLTTIEPDEDMLEVAITAFNLALDEKGEAKTENALTTHEQEEESKSEEAKQTQAEDNATQEIAGEHGSAV